MKRLALFVVLGALSACGRASEPPKVQEPPLRVARYYWPGMYWIDLAMDQRWFEEEGLPVEFVDANPDYFTSQTDTAEGRLDVNAFYLYDLVRFNVAGSSLVAVGMTDEPLGSEGLAARKGLGSIASLKGKTIAVTRGTYLELLLDSALGKAGFGLDAVKILDVKAEDAPDLLGSGKVDAAMTWEPLLSSAAARAGGRVLFDSSVSRGISSSVMVFRREMLRDRPDAVRALLRVWLRGLRFLEHRPREAEAILARIYSTTPQAVREFREKARIIMPEESLAGLSQSSGEHSLHARIRNIHEFMVRQGHARAAPLDPAASIDGRFLRELAAEPSGERR